MRNIPSAASNLEPAHPGYERARKCVIEKIDRHSVIQHAEHPSGVIAHLSKPQFSSSRAVISAWRLLKPPGGTPILIRTGKRRSAMVTISRGLPSM
jgi:hypothetical protein